MKLLIDDDDIIEIPLLSRFARSSEEKKAPDSRVPASEEVKEAEIVVPPKLGRPGDKKIDSLTKELIAVQSAVMGVPQTQLARIHGTSQAEVSINKNGNDRTNRAQRKENEKIREVINHAKYRIADRATAKLMTSLELFDPERLDQKDLPNAAKSMAHILEKVTQDFEGQERASGPTFHIYAPRSRSEESFQVIDVRDKETD